MTQPSRIRPARLEDCRAIAELFRLSSGGVADYIWSGLDMPGLTPVEIGERRYARTDTDFSYENCWMTETPEGAISGMMHCYEMAESDPPGPDFDPVLRPYTELEVAGSLYISGMAFYPQQRGRGLGTEMLAFIQNLARDKGLDSLSLLAFEQNEGAVRLYERTGYRTVDRRPVVPHAMIDYTGDVLLMVADA